MPRLVIAPIVGIAANELPARACVERAVLEHTLEAWLEPRRGISPDAVGTSPTLADPARALARVCPGRPVSVKERSEFCSLSLVSWTRHGETKCKLLAHYVYEIERQDYSEDSGLLCRASLALDEPLSWQSSATSLERDG